MSKREQVDVLRDLIVETEAMIEQLVRLKAEAGEILLVLLAQIEDEYCGPSDVEIYGAGVK